MDTAQRCIHSQIILWNGFLYLKSPHIALATVADVDIVVSWNFRHVVRFDKIRFFNAVNHWFGFDLQHELLSA
jgi:hypothetical protein